MVQKAQERAERKAVREAEDQARQMAEAQSAADEGASAAEAAGQGAVASDAGTGGGVVAPAASPGAGQEGAVDSVVARPEAGPTAPPAANEPGLEGFSLPPVIDVPSGKVPGESDMMNAFARGSMGDALPVLEKAVQQSPENAEALMRGAFAGVGNDTEKCQEILRFLAVRHQSMAPQLAESAARINPEIRTWLQ